MLSTTGKKLEAAGRMLTEGITHPLIKAVLGVTSASNTLDSLMRGVVRLLEDVGP